MPELIATVLSHLIDILKWVYEKTKSKDKKEILKKRKKLKEEFLTNLPDKTEYGNRGEAIIRDINRMDTYPNFEDSGDGISPWFKVELKGLYHRGLEVFLSMPRYISPSANGEWEFVDDHNSVDDKVAAYPVGRIPFEMIEHVDWEGDEYYPIPHIYCRFEAFQNQPYESIPFYRSKEGVGDNPDYFVEIDGFRPYDASEDNWLSKLKFN